MPFFVPLAWGREPPLFLNPGPISPPFVVLPSNEQSYPFKFLKNALDCFYRHFLSVVTVHIGPNAARVALERTVI
jgi:hypothetical protein